MSKIFYCNQEVELLSHLGNGESVIEIMTETGCCDVPDVKPVTAIVSDRFLSKNKINLEEEHRVAINERDRIIREATLAAVMERRLIESEISEMKKQVKKYAGLQNFLNFLEGKVQFVVMDEFSDRMRIKSMEEIKCSYNQNALAAVIFRTEKRFRDGDGRYGEVEMCLGEYADSSGRRHQVKGFETIDQAKECFMNALNKMEDKNIYSSIISECEKWGLTSERITEAKLREVKRDEDYRQKEIAKLRANLEKLEGAVIKKLLQ